MPVSPPIFTIDAVKAEAVTFAQTGSSHSEPSLYGVTDGKAVGTYLEHKFQASLLDRYTYPKGNSAKGIDFPGIDVDIKVTSVRQPQSSCPFKSARQKVFGLGYSLLVFVYAKTDDVTKQVARLDILHTLFVEKERTADFQTTTGLLRLLDANANRDDLLAFFEERMLPLDSISAETLADEILCTPLALDTLQFPTRFNGGYNMAEPSNERVKWKEYYFSDEITCQN